MKTFLWNLDLINRYSMRISALNILGLFVLILISCNKLPGPFDPIDDPEKVGGFIDLGSGYDVFDKFADEKRVKEHILDYKNLNSDGLVEKKDLEGSSFIRTTGTSIREYANSLAVSAGLEVDYMCFSGAITTNFSQERYTYDSYSFATYHIVTNKYQLRLPTDWDVSDLKKYLTSQAKLKLNDPDVPPSQIFNTYGTHCLTGVVVGARADYSVSGRTRDVKQGVSVGVYAEASFSKGFTSGTLNTSVISEQEFNQFASNMEEHLEVYGGDSELGHNIISKNDYDTWLASIPNKMVFCNYAQNGLIPVWEFCDDDARKTELYSAYATWASDRAIAVHPSPRVCILDIEVIEGQNAANPYRNPENGRDYYRLNYDLNATCGSGTPYIWVYYLLGLENDTIIPVTEVATRDVTDGEIIPAGYEECPLDVNKGVGGDVIRLIFKRRADYSNQLITGLRVQTAYTSGTTGNNTWHVVPIQINPTSPQDLNEGASMCNNKIWLYWTNQFVDESALPGN
jgi:hypothetical protein